MRTIKRMCIEYQICTLCSARHYLGHKINPNTSCLERTQSLPGFSSSMFLKYQCFAGFWGPLLFSFLGNPIHSSRFNLHLYAELSQTHVSNLWSPFSFPHLYLFIWTERVVLTSINMSKIKLITFPTSWGGPWKHQTWSYSQVIYLSEFFMVLYYYLLLLKHKLIFTSLYFWFACFLLLLEC